MKAISGKRFCRLLEKNGWELKHIKGSHHIFLRSSEFGLSGFRNYVQKGVNDKSTQLITSRSLNVLKTSTNG